MNFNPLGIDFNGDDNQEADRITLNVGGVKFETYISTLQNIPDTRLAWLTENMEQESSKRKEFFFDRHPGVFVHILNYYRTGKLHTPTDICGPLFEEELQFWGIDEKQMEPCCWESFTKHREAELNLRSFEGPGFEDLKTRNRKISTMSAGAKTYRDRFDNIWRIVDEPHSSNLAKNFSILSCMIIVISVSMYCMGTLPDLQKSPIWIQSRSAIDLTCMVWFTIEFIGRVIVCPDRKEFSKSMSNWIDFLSILPSYLTLVFPTAHWIKNMVIIRLLRLFRFFKLSYGLQVLLHTLKASSHELMLLLLILLIPVVIFSSLVHTVESALNKDTYYFRSIPETFWWCLITMTTVGYGDLVPETWAGKCIGSVCAICGILIVALPISVIGSNFTLYYAHVRARLKLPRKKRHILEGNLRGLLKQPLSLSSRDRERRGLKRHQGMRKKGPPGNPVYAQTFLQLVKSGEDGSNSNLDTISTESRKDEEGSKRSLSWDMSVDSKQFTDKRQHRMPSARRRPRRSGTNKMHPSLEEISILKEPDDNTMDENAEESDRDEGKISEMTNMLPTLSETIDYNKMSGSNYNSSEETPEKKLSDSYDRSINNNNKLSRGNAKQRKKANTQNNFQDVSQIGSTPTPRGRRGAILTTDYVPSDSDSELNDSEEKESEDLSYISNCSQTPTRRPEKRNNNYDMAGVSLHPDVNTFGNEIENEAPIQLTRNRKGTCPDLANCSDLNRFTNPKQHRHINCVNGHNSSSEEETGEETGEEENSNLVNNEKDSSYVGNCKGTIYLNSFPPKGEIDSPSRTRTDTTSTDV